MVTFKLSEFTLDDFDILNKLFNGRYSVSYENECVSVTFERRK